MAQRIPELEPASEAREAPVRPSEGSSDMCVPRAARALTVALVAASVLLRTLSVEGMRDPHVVELRYRLKAEAMVTFDNLPRSRETEAVYAHLGNGSVTFRMKDHHATRESAR